MSDIKKLQGDMKNSSSLETSESIELKQKSNNLKELLSDIENSVRVKEVLTENDEDEASTLELSISTTIGKTDKTLITINSIKEELCKLPLDPCELQYFNNSVSPLLQTIDSLSRVSFDLSTSVAILTTSPIVPRKKSKLKDTIHLLYNINEECEDIYKVLKKRVNVLIGDD